MRIDMPVHGEEVIQKNINDNACILSKYGSQLYDAFNNNRMRIGERVNLPVKKNPFGNLSRIVQKLLSLHIVANEISQDNLFRFTGQIDMRQIIQLN